MRRWTSLNFSLVTIASGDTFPISPIECALIRRTIVPLIPTRIYGPEWNWLPQMKNTWWSRAKNIGMTIYVLEVPIRYDRQYRGVKTRCTCLSGGCGNYTESIATLLRSSNSSLLQFTDSATKIVMRGQSAAIFDIFCRLSERLGILLDFRRYCDMVYSIFFKAMLQIPLRGFPLFDGRSKRNTDVKRSKYDPISAGSVQWSNFWRSMGGGYSRLR